MTRLGRRFSGGLCAGVLGAATLCVSSAQAAPGDGTRLEYARSERAARCPDQDALKSAIAKRLGYDPFFPATRQTIVVEITDADTDRGLRAQMRLIDDQGIIRGSRELSDKVENCGELVASLALAISIALDPSAALGADPALDDVAQPAIPPKKATPEGSTEASTKPAASADGPNAAHAVPAKRAPPPQKLAPKDSGTSPLPFTLRAGGFSTLGVAPGTAFGVRLGAGLRSDWFKLVIELDDQLPASKSVSGGAAEAALLSATLASCWAPRWFAGCALFDAGSLATEGRGVQSPLVQHSLYLAVGGRAEVSPLIVGRLRLLANVDVLKSLSPVTLRLYGQDVWRTPFASLTAGLGLELNFP